MPPNSEGQIRQVPITRPGNNVLERRMHSRRLAVEVQLTDLFIVDNSDEKWKVLQYLAEWADISTSFDVATGYFEIGALLALDGHWQKLDKLRILMGDEVSKRTKTALLAGVAEALDSSIEGEKEGNDFLTGAPAVVVGLSPETLSTRDENFV